MKKLLFSLAILSAATVNCQVLIDDTQSGGSTPNPGAVLELKSEDKGLLVPRMDVAPAQMEVEGMVYYDADEKCFKGYNGTVWVTLGGECTASTPTGFIQDFDSETNWEYVVSPAPYNVSNDVWAVVNNLSTISTLSNNYWGMRDLENTNGGGSQRHELTFDEVDISNETGVVFSFKYESSGFNSVDDKYGYELFYDNASQGEFIVCDSCNTDYEGTVSVAVPDTVNTFSVIIWGKFDGGDDIAAVDDIKLLF